MEEKEEDKVKVNWRLSKKGEIYTVLDIPESFENLKKGKKLNLYGKKISERNLRNGAKVLFFYIPLLKRIHKIKKILFQGLFLFSIILYHFKNFLFFLFPSFLLCE